MTPNDIQFLRELINPYDHPESVQHADKPSHRATTSAEGSTVTRHSYRPPFFVFVGLYFCCSSQSHPRKFLYDIVANARNSVDVDKFDVSGTDGWRADAAVE